MTDDAPAGPLQPLAPPYSDEAATLLASWTPPWWEGEPIALFRLLVRNADLARDLLPMASRLLGGGLLPARDREVLITRTTARAGAEYEWGVHATVFGPHVGLSEALLDAIACASADDAEPFSADDRLLVLSADELAEAGRLTPRTQEQLARRYSPAQVLELIVLCGWYRTLSTLIVSAGLPLESWARRFPSPSG